MDADKHELGENRGEKIEELQPSFFIPFKQLRVLEMEGFRICNTFHVKLVPLRC